MVIIEFARTSLPAFPRGAAGTGRGRPRLCFDLVQDNGQASSEVPEIPVGGKNRQVTPNSDRANKEVGVRTLNALGSAEIEKIRGRYVVLRQKRNVGERRKVSFQPRELRLIPNARKYLLPHRPDDFSDMAGHESPQLLPLRVPPVVVTPQRQRPDARIDEHPHARARWRL